MTPSTLLQLLVLGAVLVAAQNSHPADDDPRIQKQPPFHWGTPPPNHRVKLGFVPIKVLASVRHERTTKHLPREEALADASTAEEVILAKRLKEAVTTKKLGEVYTEQGYEDQNYDHGHFQKEGIYKERFKNHDKAQHGAEHKHQEGDASELVPQHNYDGQATDQAPLQTVVRSKPKSKQVKRAESTEEPAVDTQKYPFYFMAPKNSPQRYATNPKLLPDKKNNPDMPFYASTNYEECPEMSPQLSVGPDDKNPKGEPRLRGLGDKIDCLVSKYFGSDPFDNPFFKEESVHAASLNPKQLLPSESNNGPVTFITNASIKEQAERDAWTRKKKTRKNKHKKRQHPVYPNHRDAVTASTETIEGMLPPPLRLKVRKTRDLGATSIYSTARAGVKFAADPEEALEILPSHRVTTNTKYGERNYEVTEEPEELSFKYLQSTKAFPARSVKVERHRLTQEEHGLYSSTYVPDPPPLGVAQTEPVTTTVWNAAPAEISGPENVELGSSISSEVLTTTPAGSASEKRASGGSGRASRGRLRASIPEDIFQGRGERRSRPEVKQEVQRDRQRSSVRAPKRIETAAIDSQVTQVNKYAAELPEAIPTEAIPARPQGGRRRPPAPPLAGDKPAVKPVGNSIAPRRKSPKNRPVATPVPEEQSDFPEKIQLPITEISRPVSPLPPLPVRTEPTPADTPFLVETPAADVLLQEPVALVPETTTNLLTSPSTTTDASTVTSTPKQRAQRGRGRARAENGAAAPAPRKRQREPTAEAAADAPAEDRRNPQRSGGARRGRQRSRDAVDAAPAARNAPTSREAEEQPAPSRAANRGRAHATSPADLRQEPAPSARGRKRSRTAVNRDEEAAA